MLDADVSEVPLVPHAVMIHGKGPCTVDYNQSGEWKDQAKVLVVH